MFINLVLHLWHLYNFALGINFKKNVLTNLLLRPDEHEGHLHILFELVWFG